MPDLTPDRVRELLRSIARHILPDIECGDLWDRACVLGALRVRAIDLFATAQFALTDDPHAIGSATLYAYAIDAFQRWELETREQRASFAETARRNKEWAIPPEEWRAYKESKKRAPE